MLSSFLNLPLFRFPSCNSLFSICQHYVCFSGGFLICQLRVARCQLRVVSYVFRVAHCKLLKTSILPEKIDRNCSCCVFHYFQKTEYIFPSSLAHTRVFLSKMSRPGETGQHCLPNTIFSVLNQALPFCP